MRLAGPMQSWGTMSRFTHRDTGKEPSKSGVIGLICAAMGIDREDEGNADLKKLAQAAFGIRVLRQGDIQSDYHTASEIAIAKKEPKDRVDSKNKDTELSKRFYLADADFIAAIGSDDRSFLEKVQAALKKPVWQIFLGRKSFVPSLPVFFPDDVAIIETAADLGEELRSAELLERLGIEYDPERLDDPQRLIIESENGSEIRQDVPVSFADRRFTIRRVTMSFIYRKGGEANGAVSQPITS
jgi:CRISPR system Cascade subunit CasD